jgi:uncharacterized integral membrane protein
MSAACDGCNRASFALGTPLRHRTGRSRRGRSPAALAGVAQFPVVKEAPQLPQHVVKRTRMGGLWLASGSFALVLLLLLIFILENGKSVDVAYFGAHGHVPLGVALLLAAVLGILMVVIPGTARIVQLRLTARRHRRADAGQLAASQQQTNSTADTPAPDPR